MNLRKHYLFVLLLLLNFVGQATVANAMLCKMDFQMDASMMNMDHSTMKHSMSAQSVSETDQEMTMDCCQSNGSCSMMGCVVVAAVPVEIKFQTLKTYSESVQPLKILATIQIPLSVYRPPIII